MYDKQKKEFVPVDLGAARGKLEPFTHRTNGSPNSTVSPDARASEAEVLKQAGIDAGIAPENQGPVFVKGEVFELRGILFMVRGVGNKEITFRVAPKQKAELGL